MKIIDNKLIKEKSQKGLIQLSTFADSSKKTGTPSSANQNDLLALMQDSTFSGLITQQTASFSKGNLLYRGSDKRIKKVKKLLEKDLREKRLRRKTITNLLIYQNAFWEIIYKGKKANNVSVLETREMNVVTDSHGKIQGYVQDNEKGKVHFRPHEVIHVKMMEITSDVWGYAYNKNLIRIVNAKIWLQNFLHWLIKTNQFRTVFTASDAGDKIEDFLTYLRQAENHPTKHLALEGEITQQILRDFKDGGNFIDLINYYNSEIYRILQSPPIVAGTVDNSNRSNSEAQLKVTYWDWANYVRREIYLDYLNNDLLPLFGYDDVEVMLPPINDDVTTDEMSVIQALKELGMNKKGIQEQLERAGIEFNEGVSLENFEKAEEMQNENKEPALGYPSRRPQDNFDKQKTGSQSSTRPEQLKEKSKRIDFTKFPYVMW